MYRIFGLNICSDIPLPAPIATGLSHPDVSILYGKTPEQLTHPVKKGVRFQASPGEFLMQIDTVARYYVTGGNRIAIEPETGVDEESLLIFLMGSVFGALLHQRNLLVLHAGAIAVDGHSIILAGQTGVGKSTMVAGFYQRGYSVLTDDICAVMIISGKPVVVPGFMQLKLWADALTMLDQDKVQLKRIPWSEGLGKYYFPVEAIHKESVPLKDIFMLDARHDSSPVVTCLPNEQRIALLLKNTYRMYFLHGLGAQSDHFRLCASVAAQTNIMRLDHSKSNLNELLDVLEESFR